MVREVTWNKKALESLDEIVESLEEQYSLSTAEKFLTRVFESIEKLSRYPEIGRRTKRHKTVRQYKVDKNRKLYYRKYGKKLLIVFLFDERRNPSANPYQ
jgi:plasmid stabilization system protein ParE